LLVLKITSTASQKIMKKILLTLTLLLMTIENSVAAKSKYETAILAGGCFWGMQELINSFAGVVNSKVGYIGGNIENPTYELISTGITNHAEAIEITFDPQKISYEKLLKFFFTIHDPTTLNRQENDIGTQYRSEIFYLDEAQKKIALEVIDKANKSGVFKKPVVTKTSKAGKFYAAEDYHQNYLKKNPYGYTCHHVREEWKF
jgi:peptide-methionine (S)-S-oxide reductase